MRECTRQSRAAERRQQPQGRDDPVVTVDRSGDGGDADPVLLRAAAASVSADFLRSGLDSPAARAD